jgi:hypothetical protein
MARARDRFLTGPEPDDSVQYLHACDNPRFPPSPNTWINERSRQDSFTRCTVDMILLGSSMVLAFHRAISRPASESWCGTIGATLLWRWDHPWFPRTGCPWAGPVVALPEGEPATRATAGGVLAAASAGISSGDSLMIQGRDHEPTSAWVGELPAIRRWPPAVELSRRRETAPLIDFPFAAGALAASGADYPGRHDLGGMSHEDR